MFDSYQETTLVYYPERCINCKSCTSVCPHGVFSDGESRVNLARPEACMECGACALNCPVQAISVQSGVGCAWAMIGAALRGKDMDSATCGCGDDGGCCGGNPKEENSCACGGAGSSGEQEKKDCSCR